MNVPILSDRNVVLHRRAEIDFSLEANGEVSVHIGEQSVRLGPMALAIMDIYRRPMTVKDAVLEIVARAPTDEVVNDTVDIIKQLTEIGVLLKEDKIPTISERFYPFGYYDSPGVQIRILNDSRRRLAYLAAVKSVVRPGDVVLDLGSGSGILAIAAARAGARKVYAVEPSAMSASLSRLAARHGFSERIECISNWSYLENLPEKCDVLLHDIIGSEPLEMRVIEAAVDAIRRHLKPGARIAPGGVRFRVMAAKAPRSLKELYCYSADAFRSWRDWYGMDFSHLAEAVPPLTPVYIPPSDMKDFRYVTEPVEVWSMDLHRAAEFQRFSGTATLPCDLAGESELDAVIGIVDIELADGAVFSADPRDPGDAPHWMTPVWLAAQPFLVDSERGLSVSYAYVGRGRSQMTVGAVEKRAPDDPGAAWRAGPRRSMRALAVTSSKNLASERRFRVGDHHLNAAVIEMDAPEFNPDRDKTAVLVRVRAFSLNYRDAAIAVAGEGDRRVLGSEFTGVIEEKGADVSGLAIGQRVFANMQWPVARKCGVNPGVPSNKASCEYLVLDEASLEPVPDSMPDHKAAAFVLCAQTAFSMVRRAGVKEGDAVLVASGSSNMSLALVQALRLKRADVTVITSRRGAVCVLKQLGADRVIVASGNAHDEEALAGACEKTKGFRVVFDPFADLNAPRLVSKVAFFGRYVTCGVLDQGWQKPAAADNGGVDFANVLSILIAKNISLIGNCLGQHGDLQEAIAAYEQGLYTPFLAGVYDLSRLDEFLAQSFPERQQMGKAVFTYTDHKGK